MFNSLRARLWLTYAIIILLILSILGLGLLIYVIRNPIIDRQAIQRLDIALSFIQRQLNDRNLSLRQNQEYYNRISESLTIRLLLFDKFKFYTGLIADGRHNHLLRHGIK